MIALYLHMSIATYILYVLNYRLYCDLIILKIGDGLMSRSSNNFFRMEMLLLKIIEIGNGEYYGYKIVQQLQELSDDKIKLAEGVMYPILYRLLDKGYIIDEKRLVGKRKTRVYYKLEPKGKEYLNQLYIDYMDINTSIIKIMEAGNV